MREIKFRFWHTCSCIDGKEVKEMLYWPDTDFYYNYQHHTLDLEAYLNGDEPRMQFTGLKDRNGKAIYEGDIVDLNIGMVFAGGKKEDDYAVVRWDNERARFVAEDDDLLNDCLQEIEVIGNIYQNPELLIDNNVDNDNND